MRGAPLSSYKYKRRAFARERRKPATSFAAPDPSHSPPSFPEVIIFAAYSILLHHYAGVCVYTHILYTHDRASVQMCLPLLSRIVFILFVSLVPPHSSLSLSPTLSVSRSSCPSSYRSPSFFFFVGDKLAGSTGPWPVKRSIGKLFGENGFSQNRVHARP